MIDFCVWAPSEEIFWQAWIVGGICSAPGEFVADYANDISLSTQREQGWNPVKNGVPVTGFHANVRVGGKTAFEFTYGRPQVGTIWERTWAAEVFRLTSKPADPVTGFPAGMRSENGVTYADPTLLSSPTNIWA